MLKYTIGIDVGGTNIKFGIISCTGRIVARTRLTTKSFARNPKILIEAIILEIREIISSHQLKAKQIIGIGIGLPGLINTKKGMVCFLPNIPGWQNIPLKKIMERRLRIPTFLENDVNLITLGEWKYGAGRNCKNLICMTLGTGVGGGLILDNKLFTGEGYVAGEIGHMPLNEKGPDCNCGGRGCFEYYVGNTRLLKRARKILRKKSIRLEEVSALAKRGNLAARKFWEETAVVIGNGLVGVVNLLNPKLIIIGGGVGNSFTLLAPKIKKIIRQRAMKVQAKMVRIVKAQLKDDAGIMGAHVLVKESILEH